ncbi:hypothetical protein [Paenibacillus alvei]|uniref:Uncharacterized protein n=1 Tax=Paenibacillus alvei TaxID=44250 RepID=A0AAP6ZZR6_PAEAL|nr:hypothetical protein [Paenibacillus alvei]MBG9737777.1 hypothetical protein [Paenibacillus alvei]MBG9747469.1 hypothetical protein [Paenibacillus alvei]MCY9581000.1 hypothetical protein [Paenibacillus alvei]MCY9585718.1 hypothetical protein [Paenibacillus alvei]NEZ40397.1 hypothetical protein [Paenibacillus alvei]
MMKYEKLNDAFKHVGYSPYRYVHIVDVTTEAVDFDHRDRERVDQLVIGSEEPMTEEQLKVEAHTKLMEEHPDFQFFREVQVAKLDVVQAFDLELQ